MPDIENLPSKTVKPLTLLNKTNEIVDAINEGLNSSYTETNPSLVAQNGTCIWTVTHNLGTEEISCTVYEGDDEVFTKVEITSENVVTITINSVSNIEKDVYSVLILAKGGISTTPISPTITVDSEISATSTNPVQNRVLYPAISRYINTDLITIEPDGSGDFPTLKAAVDWLKTGVWRGSLVRIRLTAGTHIINERVTFPGAFINIPTIILYGDGVDKTFIDSSISQPISFSERFNGKIRDLTFVGSRQEAFSVMSNANVEVGNLKIAENTRWGIYVGRANLYFFGGTYTCSGGTCALSSDCGRVTIESSTLNFSNMTHALESHNGGLIQLYIPVKNFTNVSSYFNITINSVTSDGIIMGKWKS